MIPHVRNETSLVLKREDTGKFGQGALRRLERQPDQHVEAAIPEPLPRIDVQVWRDVAVLHPRLVEDTRDVLLDPRHVRVGQPLARAHFVFSMGGRGRLLDERPRNETTLTIATAAIATTAFTWANRTQSSDVRPSAPKTSNAA